MNRSQHVRACWLGSTGYRGAWNLQAEIVFSDPRWSAPDTLLLLEHPHVFTMGKAASAEHLLWTKASDRAGTRVICRTAEGGTYHGPGQLVGYRFSISPNTS